MNAPPGSTMMMGSLQEPLQLYQQVPPRPTTLKGQIDDEATHQHPSIGQGVRFIIQFLFHTGFVAILTFSVLQDRVVPRTFVLAQSVSRTMETAELAKVNSMRDAVTYIETIIVPAYLRGYLRWNKRFANESLVFGESIILGGLRFRQHRVNQDCTREAWLDRFGPCRPDGITSGSVYTKTPFRGVSGKLHTYSEVATLCGTSSLCGAGLEGIAPAHSGVKNHPHYPGGGYIKELTPAWVLGRLTSLAVNGFVSEASVLALAKEAVAFFSDEQWLDGMTRVLMIEFAMLNSNLPEAMFASPTSMFEFPSEGGCYASFSVIPFKLRMTPTITENVLLAIAIVVALFHLTNVIRYKIWPKPCVVCLVNTNWYELKNTHWFTCKSCGTLFDRISNEICTQCKRPIDDWVHVCFFKGRVMDPNMALVVFNMTILIATYILRVNVRTALQQRLDAIELSQKKDTPLPFLDFGTLSTEMTKAFSLSAFNLIWSYVGFYTYLGHFETFALFLRVFRYSLKMLLTFILTVSVPFSAFAMTFYLALGTKSDAFRGSVFSALLATFRLMIGDYSFEDFNGEWQAFDEIIYVMYGVFVVLIGLNVFIAIISQGYKSAVRNQHKHQTFESIRLVRDWMFPVFKKNSAVYGKQQTDDDRLRDLMLILKEIQANRS